MVKNGDVIKFLKQKDYRVIDNNLGMDHLEKQF